jgi:hypothetical protein
MKSIKIEITKRQKIKTIKINIFDSTYEKVVSK